MKFEKLPLFKTHYSIGKSILTLEDPKKIIEDGPDSVIKLALDNDLKEIILVEDGMTGFLEAYSKCKENHIKLRFGLRITHTDKATSKSEDNAKFSSKIIIFIRNENGYKRVNRIFEQAFRVGFYYEPRIDTEILKSFWDNAYLQLVIPFYDSFLFKNILTFSLCSPDFSFCQGNEIYFIEDNDLWFDQIIKEKVLDYCNKENRNSLKAQSVYYKSYADFKAYLTFRCISARTTLEKPEFEHMTSDTFCFEHCFQEQNDFF